MHMCFILCCSFEADVYLELSADLQPVQTSLCNCIEAFLLGSKSLGAVDEHMAAHIIVQQSPLDAPHNAPSEGPSGQ